MFVKGLGYVSSYLWTVTGQIILKILSGDPHHFSKNRNGLAVSYELKEEILKFKYSKVQEYSKVEGFINTKESIENLHNWCTVVAKDLLIFFEDVGENQLLKGHSKERARVKKELSIGEFSYL